jgi:hypothetical protein
MSTRPALESRSIGRKLAYGYATASVVLLGVLAWRSPSVEAWLWRSLMLLVPLVVSLRSALIYAYRKKPSALSWWLRPTAIVENEFAGTWLAYAVIFGAASLVVVFL